MTEGDPPPAPPPTLVDTAAARDLFWQNIMREMLTALSVESMNRHARAAAAPSPPALPAPPGGEGHGALARPDPSDHLFDGRLGILTHAGERIPIGDVHPLLACGINTSDSARALSMAVECTVFQVRTPAGEVYTLPLREMRGFHALTPELMRALEERARQEAGEPEGNGAAAEPFGFAAFTSLAKSKAAPLPERA